jgi:Uma2 family endonuclease
MAATATRADPVTWVETPPVRIDLAPLLVWTSDDRRRVLDRIGEHDGRRYELIDGEIVVSASPSTAHQRAWRWLFRLVDGWVDSRDLGEVFTAPYDVVLGTYQTFVPDICFVSRARSDIIGPNGVNGAPDLIVEILSPSTRREDLVHQFAEYARAGVPEYWIADVIARQFFAYALGPAGYVLLPEVGGKVGSAVLPGLAIDLAALFASLRGDRSLDR